MAYYLTKNINAKLKKKCYELLNNIFKVKKVVIIK